MNRILIVDDEQLTADTLGIIFRKRGYESKVAYSVEDALDCARKFDPHLVLCDITMPGRDGIELMSTLGRERPHCQVIVLTGYYSNLRSVREQVGKMPQAVQVLTKPCRPEELLHEAERMLAGPLSTSLPHAASSAPRILHA
jgi:CheY-like chemotaxis protein